MKKIISLLSAIAMMFTLITTVAFADENNAVYFEKTDGKNEVTLKLVLKTNQTITQASVTVDLTDAYNKGAEVTGFTQLSGATVFNVNTTQKVLSTTVNQVAGVTGTLELGTMTLDLSKVTEDFTLTQKRAFSVKNGSTILTAGFTNNAYGYVVKAPVAVTTEYTVTFKNGDETVNTVKVAANGKVATLPDAPAKTGYTFAGWYVGETQFTTDTEITADTTVTAKYTIKQYTVSFVGVKDVTVNHGETVPAADIPEVPAKEGYTGKWVANGADFTAETVITDNTTVTAEYTIKQYNVTFKVDGTEYSSVTVDYNGKAKAPETDPTKAGYLFMGWFVGEDAFDENAVITANTEVTAVFTKVVDFEIVNPDGSKTTKNLYMDIKDKTFTLGTNSVVRITKTVGGVESSLTFGKAYFADKLKIEGSGDVKFRFGLVSADAIEKLTFKVE